MTHEFRILGPAVLLRSGAPVRFHSAKALALLAYLVCQAHIAHSREKLAELLWGSVPEERARHSLRQALYSIRAELGDLGAQALAEGATGIRFTGAPGLHIDLHDFRELAINERATLKDLRQALPLCRGVLLEGLAIGDCPGFAEWLDLERLHLEQQTVQLLQRLMDALIAAGLYQEALETGQRLLVLDSLDEGSHARLLRVYAGLGDRAALQRQYRQCQALLMRELGDQPGGPTRILYEQLLMGLSGPVTIPIAGASGSSPSASVELALLKAHLWQALTDAANLLLYGEPRPGKTELIAEFLMERLLVEGLVGVRGALAGQP